MKKTAESVAEEVRALKRMLGRVGAAINKYAEIATRNVGKKNMTGSGEISESHKALFLKTNKLLKTVRGPLDMAISHFENVSISRLNPLPGKELKM